MRGCLWAHAALRSDWSRLFEALSSRRVRTVQPTSNANLLLRSTRRGETLRRRRRWINHSFIFTFCIKIAEKFISVTR